MCSGAARYPNRLKAFSQSEQASDIPRWPSKDDARSFGFITARIVQPSTNQRRLVTVFCKLCMGDHRFVSV